MNLKQIFLGISFLSIGQASLAASSSEYAERMSAGILLGPTFVNSNTQFTLAGEFLYKLDHPWMVGGAISYYNQAITNSILNTSFTTLTGQGWYAFAEDLKGLRAGVQLGIGIFTTNLPGSSGSAGIVIGPALAYDYPISRSPISVGGEATLFLNTLSGTTALFQLLASVKYWF